MVSIFHLGPFSLLGLRDVMIAIEKLEQLIAGRFFGLLDKIRVLVLPCLRDAMIIVPISSRYLSLPSLARAAIVINKIDRNAISAFEHLFSWAHENKCSNTEIAFRSLLFITTQNRYAIVDRTR